jgi:general secretion pathway protein D
MFRISTLAVCVFSAASIVASDDLADRATRTVEAEIRMAIKEAQRLASQDPAKATEKLKTIQRKLESDRVLSEERRTQLSRLIADRLRVVAAGPVTEEQIPVAPRNVEAERKSAELARLRSNLEDAAALRNSGQNALAEQRFAELLKSFSNDLVAKTEILNQQTISRKAEFDAIRRDKERGTLSALNSVDRAAVMPTTDVEFPKDWKEKIARRKSDTAPTAEELRILKALNSSLDARFKESRLEDVVDYISTLIGLPIVLDKGALDELQLTYDTPVNFAVKKPVSARAALRAITRGLGLTYVVREGVVFITSIDRARGYLVTKTYSVGDLVTPIGFLDPNSEALNVTLLIDTIVRMVDPESWEYRGGLGIIRYHPPTKSIIVRQSAEIHTMVKGSLYR